MLLILRYNNVIIKNKYVAERHTRHPFRRRLNNIPDTGTKPRSGYKKTKIEGLCNLDRALVFVARDDLSFPSLAIWRLSHIIFLFASKSTKLLHLRYKFILFKIFFSSRNFEIKPLFLITTSYFSKTQNY